MIVTRPEKIKINNKSYYNASDIQKYDIDYFYGATLEKSKICSKATT